MGAQLMQSVAEVFFTSEDESMMVTLCDGRTLEIHGDGQLQEMVNEEILVRQL